MARATIDVLPDLIIGIKLASDVQISHVTKLDYQQARWQLK